ncbi:MAG: hypothetical protein ACUVS6_01860, partial [Anaerolineae bacterium]
MSEQAIVGRVLRATTGSFTVGCRQLISEHDRLIPEFGALVRANTRNGTVIYGLIYNVAIEDDAFVRQLVAAGVESAEIIEDQRQKRQVPVVIDVLVVGFGQGSAIYHRLPPQPPAPLEQIYLCNRSEWVRFTEQHDWLRTVLAAKDVPVDPLLIAALRAGAAARHGRGPRSADWGGGGRVRAPRRAA